MTGVDGWPNVVNATLTSTPPIVVCWKVSTSSEAQISSTENMGAYLKCTWRYCTEANYPFADILCELITVLHYQFFNNIHDAC